ncbi:MAG: hypothetical protein OEY56_08305 [Cyclobacteriaceae bacterium]|nr:hypothetical protein [Cyclobacteriaceae bacterium]
MQKFFLFTGLSLLAFFWSCEHDPVIKPLTLPSGLVYTPGTLSVEVGSAAGSAEPTLAGTAPFSFNVSTVPSSGGNITIDEKGIISASGNLALGTYLVTVVVVNEAGSVAFPDVFEIVVHEVPVIPSQLLYTPSVADVLFGNSYTSTTPSLIGTAPFTFSLVTNPAPGKISIDNQGIVTASKALALGSYSLDIKVANVAGTATFNSALTIAVSNTALPPSSLVYSIDTLTISNGGTGTSVTPGISGTSPFTFTFTSVPAVTSGITIDNNGHITAGPTLPVGDYSLSITVSNAVGNAVFPSIYTVVVAEVVPVTFTKDIAPLITKACATCHTTGPQTIYTQYANASSNINLILDRVQRAQGSAGFMPKNGAPLTANEIQLLKDWLAQGLPQ